MLKKWTHTFEFNALLSPHMNNETILLIVSEEKEEKKNMINVKVKKERNWSL